MDVDFLVIISIFCLVTVLPSARSEGCYPDWGISCVCDQDNSGRQRVMCENNKVATLMSDFWENIAQLNGTVKVFHIQGGTSKGILLPSESDNKKPALEEIHITSMGIKAVPAKLSIFAPNLKLLNLSHNAIKEINPADFAGLNSLESLDISHNPTSDLALPFCSGLRTLRKISLENTTLNEASLKEVYENCGSLTDLDLSSTTIEYLVYNSSALPKLTNLGLRQSVIKKLVFVDLESANVSSTRELFKDGDIRFLNVANISLTATDYVGIIGPISERLSGLDISHNANFSATSGTFAKAIKLEELVMAHVQQSSLPADLFAPTNNIKKLDLSHNQLTTLDAAFFDHLQHLKVTAWLLICDFRCNAKILISQTS